MFPSSPWSPLSDDLRLLQNINNQKRLDDWWPIRGHDDFHKQIKLSYITDRTTTASIIIIIIIMMTTQLNVLVSSSAAENDSLLGLWDKQDTNAGLPDRQQWIYLQWRNSLLSLFHTLAHVMRHMVSSGPKRYNSHYGLNTCDSPPSGFRTEEASVCETSSGIRNTSSRFLRSPSPGALRTYRHMSSSLIKRHRQSGCRCHHCFHFGAVFHTARCCPKKHLNPSAAVPLLPLAQHRTYSRHTSWFNLPVSGPGPR